MARQKGFTLLELTIVVVLILVIAAIAIPSMREAQIHANEASAVGSIRAINQVEVQYQATYGGYAESLSNLGGADPCAKSAETACLLDQSLAGGTKSGYRFVVVGGNPSGGLKGRGHPLAATGVAQLVECVWQLPRRAVHSARASAGSAYVCRLS